MPRRILLSGAALLVIVAATAVALLLSISAGWQRGLVVRQLESVLAGALDARVRIGSITGPLYPEAVLHDVVVERDDGGRLALSRATAVLRLEIPEWRRPRLVVEQLEMRGAALTLTRGEQGRWSFESLLAGTPSDAHTEGEPQEPSGFSLDVDLRRVFLDAAHIDVRWDDRRVELDVDLLLDDLHLWEEPPRGRWSLLGARAEGEALTATATGEGSFEAIDALLVDMEARDLAALSGLVPALDLAGRGSLHANVSGPFSAPSGKAELAASELAVRGVPLGELRAGLRAGLDRRVRIEPLTLDGPRLTLRADGPIEAVLADDGVHIEKLRVVSTGAPPAQSLELHGFVGPERVDALEVRTAALDLQTLGVLLDTDATLSGRLDTDLRLDGPLPLPRVSGTGAWLQPLVRGIPLERVDFSGTSDEAKLHATLDVRLLQAAGAARFELDATRADLEGGVAATAASPRTRLRARSDGVLLEPLRPLLPEAARTLDGRLAFDLDARGARPEPRVDGKLHLTGGMLHVSGLDAPVEAIAADVTVKDTRTLRIEALSLRHEGLEAQLAEAATVRVGDDAIVVEGLRVASNAGGLDFDGRVLTKGAPTLRDARLSLQAIDVGRVDALLRGSSDLAGQLSGSLALEGPVALPRVQGEIEWLDPGTAGIEVPAEVRPERVIAHLMPEDGALAIEARVLGAEQRELLLANARLPWRTDRPGPALWLTLPEATLHAEAHGLRLETFAAFMPRALRRPGGAIDATLDLRGASPTPLATGELTLGDGSVGIRVLSARLDNITGRLVLDGNVLRVERLHAGTDEKGATLEGRIGLVDLRPADTDLKLVFDDFALPGRRLIDGHLSGTLEVHGPPDALLVTSDLTLQQARLRLPRARDPLLTEIRVAGLGDLRNGIGVSENGAASPDPWERARMDLTLHVPPNTWVEGGGATVEVTGELTLKKEPREEPIYLGALRVIRGTYVLHGRRFEVQQGVAGFTGSTELDPQVHLVGLHRVADASVVVTVSGFLSDPRIELASNPPLSQEDILALLLFGRPMSELRGGQAGDVSGAASAAAGRLAANQLRDVLQRVLPVDQLDFDPGSTGSAPRVGVGRYIGDDVFVHYGQGLAGDQRDERVRVEWRLNENWSIEGETGRDETGGADLFWRYDY